MMRKRRIIWILAATFFLISCGKRASDEVEEGRIRPVAYSEGDTLELDPYPKNLSEWLGYYSARLPGFTNGGFRASGVILHLDSLPKTTAQNVPAAARSLFAWNTDSSRYINIFGNESLTLYPPLSALRSGTGDIDQEVVMGNAVDTTRRTIMFNGPHATVETSDWLGNDVFILSRTTTDATKGNWTPEIYLFSLKDSTFTNFVWTRSTPIDSVQGRGDDFLNSWLSKRLIIH